MNRSYEGRFRPGNGDPGGTESSHRGGNGGIAVPGVSYTSIVTRNDELVAPYTSGIESAPNMTNLVVQKQCPPDQAEHVSMAADPVVAQDVLNALDPNHPAAVPCTLVLPLIGAPAHTGPPR